MVIVASRDKLSPRPCCGSVCVFSVDTSGPHRAVLRILRCESLKTRAQPLIIPLTRLVSHRWMYANVFPASEKPLRFHTWPTLWGDFILIDEKDAKRYVNRPVDLIQSSRKVAPDAYLKMIVIAQWVWEKAEKMERSSIDQILINTNYVECVMAAYTTWFLVTSCIAQAWQAKRNSDFTIGFSHGVFLSLNRAGDVESTVLILVPHQLHQYIEMTLPDIALVSVSPCGAGSRRCWISGL